MKDHISPSQLAEASECLRKWGYKSIEGLQPPAHPSAQLGTDTHLQLERYFRTGGAMLPDTNLKPGQIAMAGIDLLPKPQPISPTWPGPEFQFDFNFGKVRYKGTIDLLYVEDDCAVVLDHKTSSNPRRYGKTIDDLADDFQRVIYSVAALRFFDSDFVRARWIYYATVPPYESFEIPYGPEPAETTLLRFEKIHVLAEKLVELRRKFRASELPKNEAACGNYGGCPFRSRCFGEGANYNAREKLVQIGNGTMANPLLDLLRNGEKPKPPEHAPAPVAAPKPPGSGLLGMFAPKTEDVAVAIATAAESRQAVPLPAASVDSGNIAPAKPQAMEQPGRLAFMFSNVLSQLEKRLEDEHLSNAELIALLTALR